MQRIKHMDLRADAQQMQMTSFVRSFTPRSWWQHLTPRMVQLWAMILLRSAFGDVSDCLGVTLGVRGCVAGGVGTWYANAEGVYYVWVNSGCFFRYKIPDWGIGVWREVSSAFQRFTSPHADWTDEFKREDIEALSEHLVECSKVYHVFRALGILGGIWAPEGET